MGLRKTATASTEAQYLKFERGEEWRHEFLDGRIFAMAHESPEHADISMNLCGLAATQLKGKPCRARTKGTRVRSGPIAPATRNTKGMCSYPDVVIICGEPEYLDDTSDTILNPAAILEVLSPSTEAFDRGTKFARYQAWNPSLTDYLLVSQDRAQIEHFQRQADGSWTYRLHAGRRAKVVVATVGVTLKLADVYDRVTFADE
jgi:Uma2 family endonuclease